MSTAGPVDVARAAMQVGPHPHIGLHTVSWMIHGEVVHLDGLGSEQVLRPGELEVMPAGHGIAHAEQLARGIRAVQQLVQQMVQQMVQFWVAQPDATRHGAPAFAHHADLPHFGIGTSLGTLLVDGLARLVVDRSFEHAVLAVDGDVVVGGTRVPVGSMGYVPPGRGVLEIASVTRVARVMVLGGVPFPDRIRMLWNFVVRTDAELVAAIVDWNGSSGRFGAVVDGGLPRIVAPPVRPRNLA